MDIYGPMLLVNILVNASTSVSVSFNLYVILAHKLLSAWIWLGLPLSNNLFQGTRRISDRVPLYLTDSSQVRNTGSTIIVLPVIIGLD